MGTESACSGANANKVREGFAKLDWLVNVNIFDNETGSFWQGPGMNPKKIRTEVFMLPCAVSVEKEGSITNSGRWMQWRYKATDPPVDARSDGDIMMDLFDRIRWLYRMEVARGLPSVAPEAILNFKWDYTVDGAFDAHKAAKEINGFFLEDKTVRGQELQERRSDTQLRLPAGRRFNQLR